MSAILRILLIIPVAFLAACLSAGAFLVLALAGGADGWREVAATEQEGVLVVLGSLAAIIIAAVVAIPAFIVILLGELFRWRSVFFYLIAGMLIALAAGFAPVNEVAPREENLAALIAAAGAVAGYVYWLIAGRRAGFTGASESGAGS